MFEILIAIIATPHELCHYVAARLLGVTAELHNASVRSYPKNVTQSVIITSAPAVVGFVVMALLIPTRWWIEAISVNVAWQAGCYGDYRRIWRLFSGDIEW